jgi:hypothetical protein
MSLCDVVLTAKQFVVFYETRNKISFEKTRVLKTRVHRN